MKLKNNKFFNRGFTLFELLLVVAAFATIALIVGPFSSSSVIRSNLDVASRNVESSLHRAYTYARSGENNSDWGVHITSTDVIVFSGSTYSGRDADLDEDAKIASSVTLGGLSDVIFMQKTGTPTNDSIGEITLESDQVTKHININGAGAVTVN
ncbi:MAG: prepilin-type N-terminal cleavage/methylation domain-containing protein [Patescibacteria group bacterium]